jgi:hypothetical protein
MKSKNHPNKRQIMHKHGGKTGTMASTQSHSAEDYCCGSSRRRTFDPNFKNQRNYHDDLQKITRFETDVQRIETPISFHHTTD